MSNKYMQILFENIELSSLDVPVVAMIVKNDEIISIATNKREKDNRTIAHAEILAIEEANKKLHSWRLEDCDMYVSLEPCPMCAWAIINARIKNLYFASYDYKYGAFGSVLNLAKLANSKINIQGGIQEEQFDSILKKYFENIRDEK